MAEPTAVNGQITDAITQANITAIGNAAAQALAALQQSIAFSMSLAMQNAVAHQQAMNALSLALLAQASSRELNTGTQALLEGMAASNPAGQVADIHSQIAAMQKQMQGVAPNGSAVK